MRRLPSLVLVFLLLLVSAPQADAQLGRLLNRARQAVNGNGASADPNAPSPAAINGQPAPVLDYTRFLQMRFYPLRGEYYFNEPKNHLIFPPESFDHYGDDNGAFVVRDEGGSVVARQRIGSFQSTGSNAFMTFGTNGGPESRGALANGSYTLDLTFQGNVASRIPFSVSATDGTDPFDPKTVYHREGPWRELAYFEHETGRTDYRLEFNGWVSAKELGSENGRIRFTLTRDGEPVATCKTHQCPHVNTAGEWGMFSEHLVTYGTRDATNATLFTIADFEPGDYVMRVAELESERHIRSYAVHGGASTLLPHARSAMDYEPRHAFLTPRRLGGSSLNKPISVYWVGAVE